MLINAKLLRPPTASAAALEARSPDLGLRLVELGLFSELFRHLALSKVVNPDLLSLRSSWPNELNLLRLLEEIFIDRFLISNPIEQSKDFVCFNLLLPSNLGSLNWNIPIYNSTDSYSS